MKFFASIRALFVARAAEPLDQQLLAELQASFAPVKNLGHQEGLAENN